MFKLCPQASSNKNQAVQALFHPLVSGSESQTFDLRFKALDALECAKFV